MYELFEVDGMDQQSRAARLLLALLEPDALLSTAVFAEVNRDPRGEVVALTALVLTLVEALAGYWVTQAPASEVATEIRRQLAVLNKEN